MPLRPPSAPSSSFMRTLRVIESIARTERPVAAVELMHELSLPKPTVHRIVATLQKAGLVQRDPVSNRLAVGARLGTLALDVLERLAHTAPRHQILTRLARDTGETSTFTIYDRGEILLVDRVESAWPLQVNLFPGLRVPMHCTASGKAVLAFLPHDQRERLLKSLSPLKAYTQNTLTQPREVAAALERIRAARFATDNEEFMAGLVAIAVPVMRPDSTQVIGTVSLNGPAARMRIQRVNRHLQALRRAAQALSENFRAGPGSRIVRPAKR